MYGMVGKSVKFSWLIFTLDFMSHPFLFLALLVKLMGEFFYSLLLFYYLRLLFTFPFYIWLLTLYVPRLTNINILLTISIRNQQKSWRESINWSPNGKCFDLCFVCFVFCFLFFFSNSPSLFSKEVYGGQISQDNLWVSWLEGLSETRNVFKPALKVYGIVIVEKLKKKS